MKFEREMDKTLHLSAPGREIVVAAHIEYQTQEEELTEDNAASMTVTIEYEGKIITGYGTSYPWMDAFVSLQQQLPDNVSIKGCISCRHGNLCPVGNAPFEVFCTKDVSIREARDLWNDTEAPEEAAKRSREYTQVCEHYEKQAREYYTYTDYTVGR